MKFDPVEMGRRIAIAREAKGLNQADLAKAVRRLNPALNTPISTLSSIELGKVANPTILPEIAETLGVRAIWLKLGKGPRENSSADAESINSKLDYVFALVEGSYEALHLDPDEARELAAFVRELSEAPLVGSASQQPLLAGRILTAAAVQRFLKSRNSR